ncbi:hypothetical protein BDZ89DRAFT_1069168 [Hymenopellis radicata]|nr:hypothetical protein BDZ89DRAFT_1069168 [Hymenopellis radicata]
MSLKTPSRYTRHQCGRRGSVTSPSSLSGYSSTLNGVTGQRLNIVTRVAIEGKAKKDKDTVPIRMYLKMSLPADVEPGTTIPLFPEENIKVLTSQVHPLDNNSVPRLTCPARSPKTFNEAFDLSPGIGASSVVSSRSLSKASPSPSNDTSGVVDEKYTGHILVSRYEVSYIVPKSFPSHFAELTSRISFGSNRRTSMAERTHIHFMAAIDMLVPYVSRPPRAPYLLSIPTPRCLHNNMKLRIFPPRDGSSSSASLSDDDAGSWDLTSDPHVARGASRMSRAHSANSFADDESSDSSTAGFTEGCGIQGTFPSAERIRVRWAKPKRPINSDGRGRVGVREVKGEMTCAVRGKMKDPDPQKNGADGVIMDVEYKGTCKGVWFDGVATLLGMEVGLIAKGSEVSWVSSSTTGWDVTGGNGYTGFDSGIPLGARMSGERHDSFDSSSPLSTAFPSRDVSRTTSTSSSSSSLLRAPLPVQNVGDYSFEGTSSVSTLPSVGASTANLSQSETVAAAPPGQPITIHVNMNELLPPAHNVFTFSISGTILIVPKPTRRQANGATSSASASTGEEAVSDPEPIVLPEFTVFVVDNSTTATVVRNEVEAGNVSIEVYNSIGDYRRDPQVRKTVLQKGAQTKCGTEGGRIAFRTLSPPSAVNGASPGRARTPSNTGIPGMPSTAALARALSSVKGPARSGPAIIPYVSAVVTPLTTRGKLLPNAYAVRLTLPTTDSEWLEFGLGYPERGARQPKVDIASVSVEGVPVRYETTAATKPDSEGGQVRFEQMSGKEWISWVKVQSGSLGTVVVDYVVEEQEDVKGKRKARSDVLFDIFLPTFSLPLGKLEVIFEDDPGLEITTEKTNLSFSGMGGHLLEFTIPEFFYPHLSIAVSRKRPNDFPAQRYATITIILLISLMMMIYTTRGAISSGSPQAVGLLGGAPSSDSENVYDYWGWWRIGTGDNPLDAMPSASISDDADDDASSTTDMAPTTLPPMDVHTRRSEEWSPSSSVDVYHSPGADALQRLMSMSWDDLEPIAAASYEKLAMTAKSVWQLFRRVYHYPLPPP